MQRVLSTYRFIHQPLGPTLLAEIAHAGIPAIEVFCAQGHFSYRSQQAVVELAAALQENRLELHSLHSPTERDIARERESGVPISISETERVRRIDAVDEVKRALEVAERIPFRYLVQHMGHGHPTADPRKFEAAFNSLEHLVIFAKHRGVTIALENTPGELGSPESLHAFIRETHLKDLRLCLDTGHAHMESGISAAFEIMSGLLVTTHVHDNHGEKDEHLLPYEGTIDWDALLGMFAGAPQPLPIVLELEKSASGGPTLDQVRAVFDRLEENWERKRAQAAKSQTRI
jgi:sugar phosphate isomerase/epimerase